MTYTVTTMIDGKFSDITHFTDFVNALDLFWKMVHEAEQTIIQHWNTGRLRARRQDGSSLQYLSAN